MTKSPFQLVLEAYGGGHRQRHPCTCGPSSLALAAHALGLGDLPERIWLDDRFKKWLPVDQFLVRGLALHEAGFISELVLGSAVEVSLYRAFSENIEIFKRELEAALIRKDRVIVLNFAQDHLLGRPFQGQGEPHYSVVGGYDPVKQEILVADVDADLDEPYSCSVRLAFEGMAFVNPAFDVPRGWLVIRRRNGQ